MESFSLNSPTTAVILIDLQHGIVAMPVAPRSAEETVARGRQLAQAFRNKGATVVYLRADLNHMNVLKVDRSYRDPNAAPLPPVASEITPEAGFSEGDLLVTKHYWGAFTRTSLEEQLRARGIDTVVVAGIATNFGVESTAREAAGLGFHVVIAEDACTTLSAEAHNFAVQTIFPMLGRVRTTEEILAALA